MARVLGGDIARLCEEVSLVRLAEVSGVALTKKGKEHQGRCPFHEDEGTSLVIGADNRWRCTGCGASGDVIEWVVKRNGVSRHHAIQLLKEGLPEALAAPEPVKISTVRRLPSPVVADASDQALLGQVIGFYHDALKQSPEGLTFLQTNGLVQGELIDRFRLGLSNRTLGLRLPEKNRKAGSEIRGRLEQIGIYRESGHEHFSGSLAAPIGRSLRRPQSRHILSPCLDPARSRSHNIRPCTRSPMSIVSF